MVLRPADPNTTSPTVGTQSYKLRPVVLPTPSFTHGENSLLRVTSSKVCTLV